MKQSLTSILSLKNETFISCPNTGIPLVVYFPSCGIDFEYSSPFSRYSNLEKVCKLPSPELKLLPKVTLAGITLGLLRHHSLIDMAGFTATEANVYLQLLPSSLLISAIKLFSTPFSSTTLELLPRLSLSSLTYDVEYSPRDSILSNYLTACREYINPTPSTSVTVVTSSLPSYVKKVTIKSISSETRKTAKNCVSEIAKDELASPKLISVLKAVIQGENLVTLEASVREKIISKLETLQTPASLLLIHILKDSIANANHSEIIKNKIVAEDMARVSDDFAIVQHKKSLAEILAANMKKGN